MPRPRRIRRIFFQPDATYFKPVGIPISNLKETVLSFDELESIRLIDYEEMEQDKAAKKMKISQPTLSRLLKTARKKLAESIINGQAIKIQGGNFKMVQPKENQRFSFVRQSQTKGRGMGMGRGFGRGGGRGRMGGSAAGPGGICKCPKCGHEEQQIRGQPCMNKKCPKCKSAMIRS